MATKTTIAASTVGAGSAVAAGGYGLSFVFKSSSDEVNNETEDLEEEDNSTSSDDFINVFTFSTTENFSNTEYSGKLIDLIKKENLDFLIKANLPKNRKWWKWAYENKYKGVSNTETLDPIFRDLKDGYSKDKSVRTLSKACDEAYKQTRDKYKFGDQDYLLDNISNLCNKESGTNDISEPEVVFYDSNYSASGNYANGVLSVPFNKTKLVKKEKGTNNDLWWDWAFKNKYKNNNNSENDAFKDLVKGFAEDSEQNKEKALNQACDIAYQKPYSDLNSSNQSLLLKIKKYCSSENVNLELPEPSSPHLLSSDNNADTTYLSAFVKNTQNKSKLVDPTKSQDWWNWTFNYRFSKVDRNDLPDEFSQVNKAFKEPTVSEDNANEYLNKACSEAYKKKKADLNKEKNTKKLVTFIKEFCAIGSTNEELTVPEDSQ